MRRSLTLLALLCILCVNVLAQQQPRDSNLTGMRILGNPVATELGKWAVPVKNSPIQGPGGANVTLEFSTVTAADGTEIPAFTTHTPLHIIDPPNDETVTPFQVNCSPNSGICSFGATFTKAHPGNFKVGSGSYGLQEAIDIATGGGMVIVSPDWLGTTAQIQNASGSTTVGVWDLRNGSENFYAWNGSNYAIVWGVSSNGGITPNSIASVANINNIRYCNQFNGANEGAKAAAAIADLPSGGGTADCRGLQGAQTLGTLTVSKANVTVLFGAGTHTGNIVVSANGVRLASDSNATIILANNSTPASAVPVVSLNSVTGVEVDHLSLSGNSANVVLNTTPNEVWAQPNGVSCVTSSKVNIHDVIFDDFLEAAVITGGCADGEIRNNTITNVTQGGIFTFAHPINSTTVSQGLNIHHNSIKNIRKTAPDSSGPGKGIDIQGTINSIVANNLIQETLDGVVPNDYQTMGIEVWSAAGTAGTFNQNIQLIGNNIFAQWAMSIVCSADILIDHNRNSFNADGPSGGDTWSGTVGSVNMLELVGVKNVTVSNNRLKVRANAAGNGASLASAGAGGCVGTHGSNVVFANNVIDGSNYGIKWNDVSLTGPFVDNGTIFENIGTSNYTGTQPSSYNRFDPTAQDLSTTGSPTFAGLTVSAAENLQSLTFNSNLTNPSANNSTIYQQSGVGPTLSGFGCDIRTGNPGGSIPMASTLNCTSAGVVNIPRSNLNVGGSVTVDGTVAALTSGSGAPTGPCVTGSLYMRTNGGTNTTLYVCESTAWAAK